jgi:molybdate transport system regulatory protein
VKISARNKLQGTVQKITKGSVNSAVEIQLHGSPTITAVITNDAVDDLELQVGGSACAVIKASSVLVGVCQEGQGCGCQR